MTPTQGERIATLETKVDQLVVPKLEKLSAATDRIEARLDDLSLNGHGPDLQHFVLEDMPKVERLLEYTEVIIRRAERDEDVAAEKRVRTGSLAWQIGVWMVKLGLPAAAGSGLYVLFTHLL